MPGGAGDACMGPETCMPQALYQGILSAFELSIFCLGLPIAGIIDLNHHAQLLSQVYYPRKQKAGKEAGVWGGGVRCCQS
jgi:hypothetical protein